MSNMDRRDFIKTLEAVIGGYGLESIVDLSENNSPSPEETDDLKLTTIDNRNGMNIELINTDYSGQDRFINLDQGELDELDQEHPIRKMDRMENSFTDVINDSLTTGELSAESREYLSNIWRVQNDLENRAGSFDEAWAKLREDAQAVSKELDYIEKDSETDMKTYVVIPDVEISKINEDASGGVYFGEKFDAWAVREDQVNSGLYDEAALLIFGEEYLPEDLLSRDSGDTDDRDLEIFSEIYSASHESNEDYDFNF